MMGVFRMELYRVTHSLSTWLLMVIYFGLCLFAGGMMGLLSGNSELAQNFQQELFGFTAAAQSVQDLSADTQAPAGMVTDFGELFNMCMMGNMVVLITSVFIGIHGTGHAVTGFQKNLAGHTKHWHFAVSDLCILLLFNAVLILLGALAVRLVMCITHSHVTLRSCSGLLRYCGIYLLLSAAYGMFGAVIAAASRSRTAAIAVPVVYCTAASDLLYLLLNYIAELLTGSAQFSVEQYLPYGTLVSLTLSDPAENYIKAGISSAVFILLCMCIFSLVRRKQDVR